MTYLFWMKAHLKVILLIWILSSSLTHQSLSTIRLDIVLKKCDDISLLDESSFKGYFALPIWGKALKAFLHHAWHSSHATHTSHSSSRHWRCIFLDFSDDSLSSGEK